MKISVEEKETYSVVPEVIIHCKKDNEEVREIVRLLKTKEKKLIGLLEQEEHILQPEEILYSESVDGVTYAYTADKVYRINITLAQLEEEYEDRGYFRCSKSTVLNINAIIRLKSVVGSRIDACLRNGEHIIISRRYAKELRMILRGGLK